MKIYELSADELLEHYRSNKLLPVEVVMNLFEFIEEKNPIINAFVTLNKEEALIQAEESEKRYKEGTNIRALEGIPVAIKDLVNTKGIKTTHGCLIYKDNIPDRDATIVKRLKEAGAIIMGKTNTPEFGFKGTTENALFGPTKSPWNLDYQSGGSSGGAAASIASGFVPLAQGGDGAGSIRIPSALCGVYGFKPTFGRVPLDNDMGAVFNNHNPFIFYGPITRTVTDAALMFDVIQGEAPSDPFSLPKLDVSIYDILKKEARNEFVIGYSLDCGIFEVEIETKDAFLKRIDKFKEWGLRVEPVEISMKKTCKEYIDFFDKIWTTHLGAGVKPLMDNHADKVSEGLKNVVQRADGLSAIEFDRLGEYRSYLWHMMQSMFETYDVILTPTLATNKIAYDADKPEEINGHATEDYDYTFLYTSISNLTGQPAVSIPIGFTEKGIPIGMQAICKRLDDVTLFQFAKWVEEHLKTPTLAKIAATIYQGVNEK
ncbi:MAG: amidase [Bacillus sp. (in: firmicutes)]